MVEPMGLQTIFARLSCKGIWKHKAWYEEYIGDLPDGHKNIWKLNETDYNLISPAYNSLSKVIASHKLRGEKRIKTTVGPTGTSKILYALRPKVLIPLDIPMRKNFGYSDDAASYIKYLKIVKDMATWPW